MLRISWVCHACGPPRECWLGRDFHSRPRGLNIETFGWATRRWEQGDDMSMADFVCAEYGDGRVVADKETRTRIREVGIREIARATKINRETVSLIANEGRVKPSTLARIVELFRNTA